MPCSELGFQGLGLIKDVRLKVLPHRVVGSVVIEVVVNLKSSFHVLFHYPYITAIQQIYSEAHET